MSYNFNKQLAYDLVPPRLLSMKYTITVFFVVHESLAHFELSERMQKEQTSM